MDARDTFLTAAGAFARLVRAIPPPAYDGQVEVRNQAPGCRFLVRLPS